MSWNNARYLAGLLEVHSPLTATELAARAQLPESSVRRHLRDMLAAGSARSLGGRPERFEWVRPPVSMPPDTEAAVIAGWIGGVEASGAFSLPLCEDGEPDAGFLAG
jgi:Bacterial regulatory protein, arsR family